MDFLKYLRYPVTKNNLERAGKKGIYICGDITNIPVQDNSCDTVLSQHTLYHLT